MNETLHLVLSRRETTFPFKAYWVCVCGTRLNAPYMGSPLYKAFEAHLEEVA